MDLTALMAFLNGLGPYGVLIGAGIVLLLQKLNIKLPNILPPPTPTPQPQPAPQPVMPNLSDRPLLSLLLMLLNMKAAGDAKKEDELVAALLLKEAESLKNVTIK